MRNYSLCNYVRKRKNQFEPPASSQRYKFFKFIWKENVPAHWNMDRFATSPLSLEENSLAGKSTYFRQCAFFPRHNYNNILLHEKLTSQKLKYVHHLAGFSVSRNKRKLFVAWNCVLVSRLWCGACASNDCWWCVAEKRPNNMVCAYMRDVSNLSRNWIRFHGKYMRPMCASHFPNHANVHSMIVVIEPITSIVVYSSKSQNYLMTSKQPRQKKKRRNNSTHKNNTSTRARHTWQCWSGIVSLISIFSCSSAKKTHFSAAITQ